MEISEIAKRLAERAQDVASMLLPNGRLVGRDWCAGDVFGGAADSLKVAVSGDKRGRWADFANQPNDQGDLIDLWAKARGLTVAAALDEATEFGVVVGKGMFVLSFGSGSHARAIESGRVSLGPSCLSLERENSSFL